MTVHLLSDFIQPCDASYQAPSTHAPVYWYEGYHPRSGEQLALPRTALVEAIARGLMSQLAEHNLDSDGSASEGKMYGVLLVETRLGELRVLKAFSGLLKGRSVVDGWVPPIPGQHLIALNEAHTLAQLNAMKQELLALQQLPERQQYASLSQLFVDQWNELTDCHRERKHERQIQRQHLINTLKGDALTTALKSLESQSQHDGIERRQFKRKRDTVLQPLKQVVEAADSRLRELKHQRKLLSRQLQQQMNAAYRVTNFLGESLSLQQLMPNGVMPTGTGECCAPKLLHYAATHHLKPLALAEFWWGAASANQDKVQGEFYGACVERCQPLMGFLLAGLSSVMSEDRRQKTEGMALPVTISKSYLDEGESPSTPGFSVALPILYEDEWLIAVDKPTGLLSVPGRYRDRQDSVLSRLQQLHPDGLALTAVHRLDQDTSGILLLARDLQTHRHLVQQFQQRQVHKVYEAVLAGLVAADSGMIDLPLWGDPLHRPYQTVDWQRGKPSVTHFQAIAHDAHHTRLVFVPTTGRTHQLRVHAADPQGLGIPILGDRLYGCRAGGDRLHLHARELQFTHPVDGRSLHIQCSTPF
jgi:tRNA pseudouridine32 synthase / 23S rRNA pseudouridine746 synthase